MRKFLLLVCVLVLGSLVNPVWGADEVRTVNFEVPLECSINGVTLKPGKYKMKINGESEVEIYDRKELVVTARVEIQPLGDAKSGTISRNGDGTLKEVRLKKERVVFVG